MFRYHPHPKRAAFGALAALSILTACGTDSTGPGGVAVSPDAAKIDALVAALPDWIDNVPAQRAPITRPAVYLREALGSDFNDYKCDVSNLNIVKPFSRVLAAGSNLSNLYPGALVEGKTLRGGNPSVISGLARAPLTLRISLPLGNQSVEIQDVNSVTMAQAIADLQRRAATEQGVRDVVPANMVFELTEANTFDQSMTAVGVSAGYTNPLKGIEAGGNINSSTSRSVKTNSVVVKFVQEMYTISVAEDKLQKAANFFAASVRETDLQALAASGQFGPDNLPLYIESITFGRALFFSARSTDVIDVNELKAAMNVAGGAFKGGATLTTRQRSLLSTANYQIIPFGGPQSAATAAIASLDWSKFFVPAEATTAIPIAFTVKTLKGRQVATIHNNVSYDNRAGCRLPASYSLSFNLTRVERSSGFCLACVFIARVDASIMQTGVFGPTTGPMNFNVTRSRTLAPGQKLDLCSEFAELAGCMPFGYPGAVNGNVNNLKSIGDGQTVTFTPTVNALGAAGKFTYRITKRANYL